MKRWFVLLLLLVLLIPLPVRGAMSQDVEISATGYICEAPGGFTLYYISDTEVGISWTKGADANNTLVRAAYGRVPESRTDGYLVYYGNGTYCNDTAVNFEETASQIYYRAWSQAASGIWEETGASDWIEGNGMKIIAFSVIALALMIAAFAFKKQPLFGSSGLAWIGFGIYMRLESSAVGFADFDVYALFSYLGWAMAIFCFVYMAWQNRKLTDTPDTRTSLERRLEDVGTRMERVNRIRRQLRGG